MPSAYIRLRRDMQSYGETGRQQDGAELQQEKLRIKSPVRDSDPVAAKPDQAQRCYNCIFGKIGSHLEWKRVLG